MLSNLLTSALLNPFSLLNKLALGSLVCVMLAVGGFYEGRKFTLAAEAVKYEIARQKEAIHQASVQAEFRKLETDLIAKTTQLENLQNEINTSAAKSPTSGNISLPTDSVSRINEIR
jgi:hypothetical protein